MTTTPRSAGTTAWTPRPGSGWISFLRAGPGQMPQAMIHTLLGSVAQLAVVPMQDLLGLGSQARLNTPGTVAGNWSWRLPDDSLTPQLAQRFAQLNRVFGRV